MNPRTGPMAFVFMLAGMLLAVRAEPHDLFFRAADSFVAPGAAVVVDVLSGTFSRSENAITRDRLADFSLVTPSGRRALDPASWSQTEPQSRASFTTAEPGTYVVGAAIHPLILKLAAGEFTAYLKEEGIEHILAERARDRRQGEGSRERYSKYLKALLQVGEVQSDGVLAPLGYAAEIVPEANPFSLAPGATLTIRCIVDGQPWANKVVFAGGRRARSEARLPQQRLRTDARGRATVRLTAAGSWYVKFVAMKSLTGDPEVNYESKWSTLSFAVR